MSVLTILTDPHPVLRTPAQPVVEVDEHVRQLLDDMIETMHAAGGIGLAAPQVGHSLRCMVMDLGTAARPQIYRCVNPRITKRSGERVGEEGCLSVPGQRRSRPRAARIEMQALDEHGTPFRLKADGLLAVCIQHEIDHLDGTLFTDGLATT